MADLDDPKAWGLSEDTMSEDAPSQDDPFDQLQARRTQQDKASVMRTPNFSLITTASPRAISLLLT